ncbi:MAG: circadian clock protein KaiB [Mesorhizobium sp.]|uniref:circadian clock KaiB family protein n=1 Tax=Mesorhizobium sp. TaxID=1871066 RepID=UPI000FE82B28|nr:circadian clock KaiB family protein [Mesorhizobium sp.]RWH82163.1 MAG: circadian clock protein KaiB [Mesorhizobium sp.]RWH85164.1 MAG: circadian clock protein KaiB [Mesorhizobium sp.]RWH89919.1 MAG: circadian clock protein KaiB [Mesorhizobium sp.]RWH98331.1 MAG: circadian clock protein KaiB [Mesorhizobium sp.]RWI04661.1 MAG: circadian clock protein KaiB [Mesorhizobium sp.]
MSRHHSSDPGADAPLRLYIAGDTSGARRALESRLRMVEELNGRIEIEIIDILLHPEEAEKAGILATPTLSDDSATPPRRLIGDISNIALVLDYFGLSQQG